jgi:two-component system OmpR family sensor kinase
MSLRLRLLLGLVALVAIGLAATDAVTYLALQGSLSQRLNEQISQSTQSAAQCYLTFESSGGTQVSHACESLPPNTWFSLTGPGASGEFIHTAGKSAPKPKLPAGLAASASGSPSYITVPAKGVSGEFRVLTEQLQLSGPGGEAIILAFPLNDVDVTLGQLRLLEALVSGIVLLLLGLLAWWTVQLGLSPLRRIRDTAQKIAAGDLTQRVESTDPRTEVGQLGLSLNEMLAQIERAFQDRTTSEARLRQFVADASHELRTPLSSIRGYAELFRRGARANPEDLAKAMTRIESESVRMGQLVDDLLILARLDEGRPLELRPVDLSQLAVDTAADQAAADRRHPITVAAPVPVVVAGDEARLRQVITNLVRNAVVHTPGGTSVEIRTELRGGTALLEVVDHGPGIPADAAERIFERFVRVDKARGRTRGGAGLGLAIVAAIVAAHGGQIQLEATPGGGATFRLTLQLDRQVTGLPSPQQPLALESGGGAKPPQVESAPAESGKGPQCSQAS